MKKERTHESDFRKTFLTYPTKRVQKLVLGEQSKISGALLLLKCVSVFTS